MTLDDFNFLRILARYPTGAVRSDLPMADRKQDRVRQRCKKNGWARWHYGTWQITAAGRSAIADDI